MRLRLLILLIPSVLMMIPCSEPGSCAAPNYMSLSFADRKAWSLAADKPWWSLVDVRDMLNVFHPYSLPQTGNAAGASRQVIIPAEWKPPFALRFYCADDYFADAEKHKRGQLGTESFFDHRFKQVLIDDTVVWERDVADENTHGSQTTFQVDLTRFVTPGKSFKVTFRVFDKVSTTERNDRDVWFIGGTWYAAGDGKTEQPPRFHTAIWFADPVIGEKQAVESASPGKRPNEAVVTARHKARWPMSPPGEKLRAPAAFELVSPAAIPPPGFPVTCGIPVPPGMLKDTKSVRLRDATGKDLPVQTKTTGLWPDGSVRWFLLNTLAPAGAKQGDKYQLHTSKGQIATPRVAVKLEQKGQGVSIRTGAAKIELGADPHKLIDAVYLGKSQQPVMASLSSEMSILLSGTETPVSAMWEKIDIVDKGPVVARLDLSGTLATAQQPVGRFVFRLYAYAGLPTIQTSFRIINDVKPEPYTETKEDPPLEVTRLSLVAQIPGAVSRAEVGVVDSDPIGSAAGSLLLVQDTLDHFKSTSGETLLGEGKHAQGWIAAAGEGGWVQASMWRFWQQFPKFLAVDSNGLHIGLFTPTEATPAYRPRFGEAKRHDVWFTFQDKAPSLETQKSLGLLADEPPRLFNGEWFCRSGGINVLDPHFFENHPKSRQYVSDHYGDVSTAKVTGQFGLRNFGDWPYNNSTGQWLNGYWAMVQGALNWGLASGDQRWLQRSFEIARHIADVDSVHIPTDHPDWNEWNGLTCALGVDHSVHNGGAKWPAFQIGESLILHYWMTGDPDSLDAGVANADYILRSQAGLGSSEARSQARAMLTLLRAWEATGDTKYRDGAKRYLDLKYQTEKVIDWRRGAYIQPTYENWRCVSAGLDSMYAHDIYEYYRLTGDIEAAQMVVAIADSVYAESMLPQQEGLGSFLFYVRYSRQSWYYTQMAMLFHMAYDLTGDLKFLRAGRAAFERYVLCLGGDGKPMYQPFHNFGWLDPEFGGWLEHFKDVRTDPFTITSETPVPDPSNYVP